MTLHLRSWHLILYDALVVAAAYGLAFVIRFDTGGLWLNFSQYWHLVGPTTLFYVVALNAFGLHRRAWRYASVPEVVATLAAATLALVASGLLFLWLSSPPGPDLLQGYPRSVLLLQWLLGIGMVGGGRFALRVFEEWRHAARREGATARGNGERRVLVVGAGDAGAMIVREMQANPGLGMVPVGFVDDDPRKLRLRIRGVPVIGDRAAIARLIQTHRVGEVIIAMPTASGRVIREIITVCKAAGVRFRTIPAMYELIDGRVSVNQVRDVRIEDLLRRDPVALVSGEVEALMHRERVLVSGAGGSIGAELCRQIAAYHPAALVLFDNSEHGVFEIELELRRAWPELPVHAVIGNVGDGPSVDRVLATYAPTILFHAAARKHVSLMEQNVREAVVTNALGTARLAQAASDRGVRRFILISTDKAVRPTSVYGATKRLAEMVVQSMAPRSGTIFSCVRFGNVLGSRGSVVPIFQQQIAAGGPLTITHPAAQRFFMTIPEAVSLVLRAAALGRGGEVFVLDMGEPVRILDLATDLLQLSGLQPGRDIDIQYVGLGPGEKLVEELTAPDEELLPTAVEKVRVVRPTPVEVIEVERALVDLGALAAHADDTALRRRLQLAVTDFAPTPALPAPIRAR